MDLGSLLSQYIEYLSNDAYKTKEVLVRNSKEFLSTSKPGYRFALEVEFYDDVERIAQKFDSDEDFFKMMKAGMNSLEKYGVNLWRFPWRKEYHTVKLYTAFFKNIEKQLKDKEFIFSVLKFLGYTERDEHKVYIKDSGRRNPMWASFNLFLLQVELQIMKEIQSQNSSRNIPLKEIVKSRSKRRTMEDAIRYLGRKSFSKQPELDLSKATDSGVANASNRSNEPTFRNGYVRTAQLPHQKLPLGGVDSVRITDNVLYGVNPEESQPEHASAYNREVRDQNSSRYDDASGSAMFREKTGNSQHVTTPPTGRPQYSANTKGGQQHDADSSYYTFHQLGLPHSPRLTNAGVKDPDLQPALLSDGLLFNSSAEAAARVHGINPSRYANLRCNAGSDCQNIGCSGSDKSLPTKEGGRHFEDRLTIIQQTAISCSAQGLIRMEGETHVRSSNHLSSNDEPSNVSKTAKAPQQQKNMSSEHKRQQANVEHFPSGEEAAKSQQAHRLRVDIESPTASTAVYNISPGAAEGRNRLPEKPPSPVQNRTNGDSPQRKEDGSARHFPPSKVQNHTEGSVKSFQTGAVSVAQTTSSHETRAFKQAVKGECYKCLVPASYICRSCFRFVCGKCKVDCSEDLCEMLNGGHQFVILKASEGKGEQGIGISGEEWSCLRCTFFNLAENKICAMCSTTRGLSAMELSKPGSRVCSVCTYHNKENAKICGACSITLDLHGRETMC
nr:uncharacterized protein LOC131786619 [Pocillopora verrucosa]